MTLTADISAQYAKTAFYKNGTGYAFFRRNAVVLPRMT